MGHVIPFPTREPTDEELRDWIADQRAVARFKVRLADGTRKRPGDFTVADARWYQARLADALRQFDELPDDWADA